MRQKQSKSVGLNQEVQIPLGSEALNPRLKGGQAVPNLSPTNEIVPPPLGRNSTGVKSKYPLQVSREGERRV